MSSDVEYDPNDKTIISKIIRVNLKYFSVPANVTGIKGGTSNTDSAFYPCASSIKNVTFEKNSKIVNFGDFLFSRTTLECIDMSNCVNLESLSKGIFIYCNKLVNVTLPPNLIKINSGSFTGCSSIESLIIPDSVQVFDSYSGDVSSLFDGCRKLKTIQISENSSLKTISSHAFMNTAIKSIYIPRNVSSIGAAIFIGSDVETIVVSPENKNFRTDGVIIYSGNKIITTAAKSKINYTIPENATFGSQALRGNSFESITFAADKNYELPFFCFGGISAPTVKLPDSITSIGSYCFVDSKITSIVIPKSTTVIYECAFYNCKYLVNITLPLGLKTISNYVFKGSNKFLYIEIPYNVVDFGQGVFTNCHINLVVNFTNKERFQIVNDLVINNGSTIVEYFGEDESYELEVPSFCNKIGSELFKDAATKAVTFKKSENSITIGDYAFAYSTLQIIVLPSTLSSIGKYCFVGCSKLKNVVYDGTVTSIPESCFRECTVLDTLVFQVQNIKKIEKYAFFNTKALPKIDLVGLSVEYIEDYAFSQSGIKSITIPSTIQKISKYAFQKSSLTSYTDNSCLTTQIDFLLSGSSSLVDVVLGRNIDTIGQYSFENCISLKNLTLSTATKKIEMYAFSGCISLEYITIPDHSALTRIMPFAFNGCNKFNNFEVLDKASFFFHNGVLMNAAKTSLMYYIPLSRSRLFVVAGTIQTIGAYAFHSCKNLREVFIPDGNIQEIGVCAFADCTSLRRIYLPPSITSIADAAFDGCKGLKCGGVVIEEELVEQAKKSGIKADVLSSYCINPAFKYGVSSCRRNSKYQMPSRYAFVILVYTNIN